MTVEVEWGSATSVGRVRPTNQDAVVALPPVFAVADGMGGHSGGETASRLAAHALSSLAGRVPLSPDELMDAIRAANAEIWSEGRDTSLEGMGTTLTGLALSAESGADAMLVFNVGDSRTYRLRGGKLEQVSVDHSIVGELVATGDLAPAAARSHPQRNVITRALGAHPDVTIDCWLLRPGAGERFLLCSDGLTNELELAEVEALLAGNGSPSTIAAGLVDAAVAAGGRDNVSAVVVVIADGLSADLDADTSPGGRRLLPTSTVEEKGSGNVVDAVPMGGGRPSRAAAAAPLIESVPRTSSPADDAEQKDALTGDLITEVPRLDPPPETEE